MTRWHISEVDVRRFSWSDGQGGLHIEIIDCMRELGIPWSEENEHQVTKQLIAAARALLPKAVIEYVQDRERPDGKK